MKHIQTLNTRDMVKSAHNGGCGECQTSCQSACKTSCGIANQPCENKEADWNAIDVTENLFQKKGELTLSIPLYLFWEILYIGIYAGYVKTISNMTSNIFII